MFTESPSQAHDIAIVGIGSLFPGSTNLHEFWNDIYKGIDRISPIPHSHWDVEEYYSPNPTDKDKTYCAKGGFLPTVHFNPLAYGIPPNSLTATDTGQILGLLVAKQTLDDFCDKQSLNVPRERVSVILGTTGATELITDMASRLERPKWFKALLEEGIQEEHAKRICDRVCALYPEWQESTFPGLLSNVIAGRIANRLDLKGSNFVTDAACASSLAALQFAIQDLVLKQSDLVISGGVDALNTIFMYMCFSKTPALSPTGDCRPFSENADGTLIGEGIGMVALKRLKDAEQAGDKIYAVIKGIGSSSDGLGKSIYAPVAEGQERALRRAYQIAGYSPETVELMEAHGTGTKAGDSCEVEGLHKVFKSHHFKKWCAIGSIKSQIGHTKAAAGIAGLIKASLALHHKIIPPSLKVSKPQPAIYDSQSPFYVNTFSRPWIRDSKHPRRAGVSSFGFGGSNFHLTLEEYRGTFKKKKLRQFTHELFCIGTSTRDELISKLLKMFEIINVNDSLNAFAERLQKDFKPGFQFRFACVANSLLDLKNKIQDALLELKKETTSFSLKNSVYFSSQNSSGSLAIMFPGQGSQYLQMSSELTMTFDCVREIWDEIADFTIEESQNKLHNYVFPPSSFSSEEETKLKRTLQNTEWAQPAIASTSAAMFSLLSYFGIKAHYYIGHSLGAFTALYASQSLKLNALVKVSRQRGLLMSKVSSNKKSGMLAVSASIEKCAQLISQSSSQCCIANMNSQDQTILSGEWEELEKIKLLLLEKRLSHTFLPVSTAFHSPQMKSIHAEFARILKEVSISKPQNPVFSCLTSSPYPSDPDGIVSHLVKELSSPVQFMQSVQNLFKNGVRTFIEVGPKNVLSKLTQRILRGESITALALDEKEGDSIYSLWNTLAQLMVVGVPINLENLSDEFKASEKAVQNQGFTVAVNGANLRPPQTSGIVEKEKHPNMFTTKEKTKMDSQNNPLNNEDTFVSRLSVAQKIQMEAARLHGEFQKTLSETHLAFLKSTETCFELLLQGGPEEKRVQPLISVEEKQKTKIENNLKFLPQHEISSEISFNSDETLPTETFKFTNLQNDEAPLSTSSIREDQSIVPTEPSKSSDFEKILLSVISEKTGYPEDLLKLEMSLDTDLGIDSIKRVEIFSQLSEHIPQAGSIDPQVMNKLSTLQNILDFLEPNQSETTLASKKKSNLEFSFQTTQLNT